MKAKFHIPFDHGIMIPRIIKLAVLLSALFVFAISPSLVPLAQGKEAEIFLLHTNSVGGYLLPCPS